MSLVGVGSESFSCCCANFSPDREFFPIVFKFLRGLVLCLPTIRRSPEICYQKKAKFNGQKALVLREQHTLTAQYQMIMTCQTPTPTLKSHELEDIVRSIFGNRNHSRAASDLRIDEAFGNVYWRPADSVRAPFELTALRCFSSASNQAEQCIGILELAGGYRPADLAKHFSDLESCGGLDSADLQDNNSQVDAELEDPDGEVLMDIDVVDALTPAAHIVIYFAPQTDRGCVIAWRMGASAGA